MYAPIRNTLPYMDMLAVKVSPAEEEAIWMGYYHLPLPQSADWAARAVFQRKQEPRFFSDTILPLGLVVTWSALNFPKR